MKAVQVVEEFSPFGEDDPTLEQVELVKRYATVRPFLSMFASTLPLRSTEAGASLLQAVRGLGALVGRKRVERSEIVDDVVGGVWRRLVFSDPAAEGPVDHRAYTLCVLEGAHRALRRRDLFAEGSTRWGAPRVQLLDGLSRLDVRVKESSQAGRPAAPARSRAPGPSPRRRPRTAPSRARHGQGSPAPGHRGRTRRPPRRHAAGPGPDAPSQSGSGAASPTRSGSSPTPSRVEAGWPTRRSCC